MKKQIIKILHITPHLGGGVGRVVLNYLSKYKNNLDIKHRVVCLDYANDEAKKIAIQIGISLDENLAPNNVALNNLIAESDIVLIHWWNHPLLFDLLVRKKLPPSRVILWSHISGFHPPYVFTGKILEYPDLFVFTTPVSYETREVECCSDIIRKKLRVVWSTGGVDHVRFIYPKNHDGFNVGYIGTVDYAKINSNFFSLCNRVEIPNVKFIVCGGSSETEFIKEAQDRGIAEKFDFTGLVSKITEYLSIFDVFGYPLSPYHYGTCDQVLAESMAAGVVPVVLANRMERFMVKDGVTGIVARDELEYVKALENLYFNEELRNSVSCKAKEYACQTFSIDKMIYEWEKIFDEILSLPKTEKKWDISLSGADITAKDVFLESLGDYAEGFVEYCNSSSVDDRTAAIKKILELSKHPIWNSETRGTVHHYRHYFPGDKFLSFWSQLIKSENNKY